jgi:proton glutamate symport protein
MRIRLEYLLLLSFLLGLLIAYLAPFKIGLFSLFVDNFIAGFLFLSPVIVFVIIFNSTCSLMHERDLAGQVIKNSVIIFVLLVLGCSLFASLVLSFLSPTTTTSTGVSAGVFSYIAQIVFLSSLRPVTLALVFAVIFAFVLSRTSLFKTVVKLSTSVYKIQEQAFEILVKVFPAIAVSLGATLYYNLGNVSLAAYVISMGLTLTLGLAVLIALLVSVRILTRAGLKQLGRYSTRMFATGLAIGSSYLALPMALSIFKHHFHTRGNVADLVLTLGTSLNRCGSVMGVLAVSFVAARYTGIEFSSQQILLLAIPIALIGFGSPGIQGGTLLVSMPLILDVITSSNATQFSAVAVAIFVGGTTFIQAAVNSVANGYVTLLVASARTVEDSASKR